MLHPRIEEKKIEVHIKRHKKFWESKKERFTPVSKKLSKVEHSFMSRLKEIPDAKLQRLRRDSKYFSNGNLCGLTSNESMEINSMIKSTLNKELTSARDRLSKRLEKMKRIGIVNNKINDIRGQSLFSVESNLM